MSDLTAKRCKPCEGGVAPLSASEAATLLAQLDGWALEEGRVAKTYAFKNHYEAVAFVNAVAWISHREDHHPDLALGYNSVRVTYITHAIGGLSENDFICAAKIDRLFEL
jgi:4a-hydroxytetrahydrobiopterin dehydratase